MSCRVLLSAEAEDQLRGSASWWQANRPAAPGQFENVIRIIEEMPETGSRFLRATLPGVRRILLRSTGYWVYYVPDTSRSLVYVLALWSARQGSDPPMEPHGR